VLHVFAGYPNDEASKSALTASGPYLYGTSILGGSNGGGTIFRYDPVSNTPTVLYSFTQNSHTDG
jgi:uncharacterized repeat protein (TIGR03803 family)